MKVFENVTLDSFTSKINFPLIVRLIIIFAIGFLLIRIFRFVIRNILSRNQNRQSQMLVNKFVTYAGFSVLFIILLSEMGIQLNAILGAAGILGLAVGVASQKSLGNIISGLFLVAEKSFEIGDVIKVGDKTGSVYSVDFLAIMLKTFDNLLIRIPNETLISAEITNITRFPIRRMDFALSVSHRDDLKKVMEILLSIALNNPLCLDDPQPLVLLKDLSDSGTSVQFGVWFEKANFVKVRNSVIVEIKKNFGDENITIPHPHMTLNYGEKINQ